VSAGSAIPDPGAGDALVALARIGGALAGARNPVTAMNESLSRLAQASAAQRAFLVRIGEPEIDGVRDRLAAGESVVLDAPERHLEPLRVAGELWGAVGLETPRALLALPLLRAVASILADALERFRADASRPTPTDARFDLLTDNASDIVAEIDPEARFVYLNPRMQELTGWPPAELLGSSFSQVIHPDDLPDVAATFRHLLELREPDPIRYRIRCRDGSWLWLESSGGTITLPDGRLTTVVVSRDVTRRERTEAEVRQAQRLEAVGTLAGGVAHDFNNLLAGILGHASLLRDGRTTDAERSEAVEVIESAARRAADLTQQLLGFAGRAQRRLERVDVHRTIEDLTRLLSRTIPRNVELSLRLGADGSHVQGDPSQIQQVLLNLALNARDAMPDGGRLEIETRTLPAGDGAPHGSLEIAVRDTGPGIPEALRERIFEPFFTTKGSARGSGMGLAVVYGVVTAHRGTVRVEGATPRGAVFRITFPLAAPGPVVEVRRPIEAEETGPGRGRILVADDEPAVRSLAARMLRRLGYEVATAVDGQQVLDAFAADGQLFDLVILDLDMPRLDGAACFRALRARHPGQRALVSTGYGHPQVIDALLAEGLRGIVPKPYSLEQLAHAVGDALRDESTGASGPGAVGR